MDAQVKRAWTRVAGLTVSLLLLGCAEAETSPPVADAGAVASPCPAGPGPSALSTCLKPKQKPAYYIDQAQKYFDALDRSAPPESVPAYSELVARWEWPPWLKLTGYTRTQMEATDKLVKSQAPAVVSHRDCRAFGVQPFARCRVSFDYDKMGDGKPCAIYEEFTFNDQGEMSFVEAWSDAPAWLPMDATQDSWAEGPGVHRLSTRLPGLGSADGRIDLTSEAMLAAAAQDLEVADFVSRAKSFWVSWAQERKQGGDYFKVGCGW